MLIHIEVLKEERKKIKERTTPRLAFDSSRVATTRGIVTRPRMANKFDSATRLLLPINGNPNDLYSVA